MLILQIIIIIKVVERVKESWRLYVKGKEVSKVLVNEGCSNTEVE